jgi:TP901 family phage tail tape measure protein
MKGIELVADVNISQSSLRRAQKSLDSLRFGQGNANGFNNSLGNISGKASELSKSLDAATARVVAFGATVTIINAVTSSFSNLISATINTEQRFTELKSILNDTKISASENASNFKKLREEVFLAAKATGQSFDVAATAATEFARQGASVEETSKRLTAALILTRTTGLDAAKSVESLTAVMNGYTSASLSASQIVNKFVAVDDDFAVSAKDIAEALSRSGSAANDAGVKIDELIGLVAALQEKTARGGPVIGNALKSIFTRLSRSTTVEQLQNLGLAINESQTGTEKLKALALGLKEISDPGTISKIKELAGGVYQINLVSAALNDIASGNSSFEEATTTSLNASNEAFKRNADLSQTLAHNINELVVSATKLGSSIGTITFAPIIKDLLTASNRITDFFSNALSEEGGSEVIKRFFAGIGKFISGPGLVLVGGALLKLSALFLNFAKEGLSQISNLVNGTQKIRNVQQGIIAVLNQDAELRKIITSHAYSLEQKEFAVLQAVKAHNAQLIIQKKLMEDIARASIASGVSGFNDKKGSFTGKGVPRVRAAGGFVAEEVEAMLLGAKNPKAKYTKGTIGGKKGIMNSEEVEIRNFLGGKDSAIIPKYGGNDLLKKVQKLNKGFAGGLINRPEGGYEVRTSLGLQTAIEEKFFKQQERLVAESKYTEKAMREYRGSLKKSTSITDKISSARQKTNDYVKQPLSGKGAGNFLIPLVTSAVSSQIGDSNPVAKTASNTLDAIGIGGLLGPHGALASGLGTAIYSGLSQVVKGTGFDKLTSDFLGISEPKETSGSSFAGRFTAQDNTAAYEKSLDLLREEFGRGSEQVKKFTDTIVVTDGVVRQHHTQINALTNSIISENKVMIEANHLRKRLNDVTKKSIESKNKIIDFESAASKIRSINSVKVLSPNALTEQNKFNGSSKINELEIAAAFENAKIEIQNGIEGLFSSSPRQKDAGTVKDFSNLFVKDFESGDFTKVLFSAFQEAGTKGLSDVLTSYNINPGTKESSDFIKSLSDKFSGASDKIYQLMVDSENRRTTLQEKAIELQKGLLSATTSFQSNLSGLIKNENPPNISALAQNASQVRELLAKGKNAEAVRLSSAIQPQRDALLSASPIGQKLINQLESGIPKDTLQSAAISDVIIKPLVDEMRRFARERLGDAGNRFSRAAETAGKDQIFDRGEITKLISLFEAAPAFTKKAEDEKGRLSSAFSVATTENILGTELNDAKNDLANVNTALADTNSNIKEFSAIFKDTGIPQEISKVKSALSEITQGARGLKSLSENFDSLNSNINDTLSGFNRKFEDIESRLRGLDGKYTE